MRLIDADAFKEYIRGACEEMSHVYKDGGKWAKQITEDFCMDIDEQPTVEPQRWIPCSERLPEESGSYFVSGKWASGKVAVGDCEYSKDDGYFQTAWNFDVEAWMPLPMPYEGE